MKKITLMDIMRLCYTYRYEVRLIQYDLVQSSDLLFDYHSDISTYKKLLDEYQNREVKYFNSYVDQEGLPVIRIILEQPPRELI